MRKNKNTTKAIEEAIMERFPDVTIYEIRNTKFGTRVLGIVPARNEYDVDHIVEWTDDGKARECTVNERNYREIGWDEEYRRPIYIQAKLLLSNEAFNVNVNES